MNFGYIAAREQEKIRRAVENARFWLECLHKEMAFNNKKSNIKVALGSESPYKGFEEFMATHENLIKHSELLRKDVVAFKLRLTRHFALLLELCNTFPDVLEESYEFSRRLVHVLRFIDAQDIPYVMPEKLGRQIMLFKLAA